MYRIKRKILKWFQSYLTNKKQFRKYSNQHTNLEVLQGGVTQGSTLRPLLFFIFVNDLKKALKLFSAIMFSDFLYTKVHRPDSIPLKLPSITFSR